jgi:S-adenosylmethionine hydrolase
LQAVPHPQTACTQAGYVILEISVTIIDIFGNIWTNISEIIIKALCELREIYFSTFLFAV